MDNRIFCQPVSYIDGQYQHLVGYRGFFCDLDDVEVFEELKGWGAYTHSARHKDQGMVFTILDKVENN